LEKIAKSMVIARGNKGLRHVGFFNIAENICRGRRSYTAYVYPWGEQDRHDSWESSNWSGNQRWIGTEVLSPSSLIELQEIVSTKHKVRAIGSTHSFSPLFQDSKDGILVSLRKMPRRLDINAANYTITVDAGTTYSELCYALSKTAFAIPMTASLPQFGIVGGVATATHGSSGMDKAGNLKTGGLATAVVAMDIVGPDGEIRRVSRGDEGFEASVVSLGCVGIVVSVTLSLVDRFSVRQRVYGSWPPGDDERCNGQLTSMLEFLPEAIQDCDAFSLFIDFSQDSSGMLVLKDFVPWEENDNCFSLQSPATSLNGLPLMTEPITSFLEGSTYETTGLGPWYDKLGCWTKDAIPFGPQEDAELQFEHFVPIEHVAEALERTKIVSEHWKNILYSEIRAVRSDNQLLSPYSFASSSGGLGISHGLRGELGEARVVEAAAVIEEGLEDLGPRPHWGKLSAFKRSDFERAYGEKLVRFQEHRRIVDPNRKFTNSWIEENILEL